VPEREFTPYYAQIMNDIRARIASGEWPPGHQLPSTATLLDQYGERLGVRSASTVREAISRLLDSGELRGHQGLGVFVAPQP
jgi:DNA-binding GntR family transcriptional regulator